MNQTFQDPICQAAGCKNPTAAYVNVNSAAASSVPSRMEARCEKHGGAGWNFRTFGNTKDDNPAYETLAARLAIAEARVARLEQALCDVQFDLINCSRTAGLDACEHATDAIKIIAAALAPAEAAP